MAEANYQLLPLFIVLDVSASMGEEGRFDAAFSFLPKLLGQLEDNAVVSDKLKVCMLTFGEEANVVLPLTDKNGLRKWLDKKTDDPIEPVDRFTRYSVAFKSLKREITAAVEQIKSDSVDGNKYTCFRPAVFFITDGNPYKDSQIDIDEAFAELTDEKFPYRPFMVCIGVGEVDEEILGKYSAGKYKRGKDGNNIATEYIKGNPDLTLVQKDGVISETFLSGIIVSLIQSVLSSFNKDVEVDDDSPVTDIEIELPNDLFGDCISGDDSSPVNDDYDWLDQ